MRQTMPTARHDCGFIAGQQRLAAPVQSICFKDVLETKEPVQGTRLKSLRIGLLCCLTTNSPKRFLSELPGIVCRIGFSLPGCQEMGGYAGYKLSRALIETERPLYDMRFVEQASVGGWNLTSAHSPNPSSAPLLFLRTDRPKPFGRSPIAASSILDIVHEKRLWASPKEGRPFAFDGRERHIGPQLNLFHGKPRKNAADGF
jgi:hypothetical protein